VLQNLAQAQLNGLGKLESILALLGTVKPGEDNFAPLFRDFASEVDTGLVTTKKSITHLPTVGLQAATHPQGSKITTKAA